MYVVYVYTYIYNACMYIPGTHEFVLVDLFCNYACLFKLICLCSDTIEFGEVATIVEASKLEHERPPIPNQRKKGHQRKPC